jgi:hypothetical protein
MPILFDFHVSFTCGTKGCVWNFNSDQLLCLTSAPGAQFELTRVITSYYGLNVYAIQSVTNKKYLALVGNGPQVSASCDHAEKALLFRATPTNGPNDPFLWEIASTGDFLRVDVNQDCIILANGSSTEDWYCHLGIAGSIESTIVTD